MCDELVLQSILQIIEILRGERFVVVLVQDLNRREAYFSIEVLDAGTRRRCFLCFSGDHSA